MQLTTSRFLSLLSPLIAAMGLIGFASQATAAPIPIDNSGFEDFALSAPGDFTRQQGGFENGTGIVSPDAVPGWTTTPLDSDAGTGTFWSTTPAASEGVNVAYVATVAPGVGFTALEQTLPSVLTANTLYTLEVDVSHGNVEYRIELRAGGIVLAADANSLSGPVFQTSTLIFATGAAHPGLGMPLIISLQGGRVFWRIGALRQYSAGRDGDSRALDRSTRRNGHARARKTRASGTPLSARSTNTRRAHSSSFWRSRCQGTRTCPRETPVSGFELTRPQSPKRCVRRRNFSDSRCLFLRDSF